MDYKGLAKTALSFGSIGAGLAIALFLILAALDQNPLNKGKYFDVFMMVLILLVGLKYFRDVENQGSLTFVHGIGVGLGVSWVAGIISSGFLWIYLEHLDPEMLEKFKESGIQYYEQSKAMQPDKSDPISFAKTIQDLESISVVDVVVRDILRKLIIGLFLSTILSLFLRK